MTKIISYSRINLGLIDLSANSDRIDGSHGFYTNLPIGVVKLQINGNGNTVIKSSDSERYYRVVENCKRVVGLKAMNVFVSVENFLGRHQGLGSGTQLSMAIVECFNIEFNLNLTIDKKAYLAESGGSSGVGVYCFEHGGYVLDGGRQYPGEKNIIGPSEDFIFEKLPPLISRIVMPDWFICIIVPNEELSIFGDAERNLFKKYTPISDLEINKLCRQILMGIIPAAVTKDFKSLCISIDNIMKLGFRAKEISTYGTSIENYMQELRNFGFYGVGMSSFGPAVFGLQSNKKIAEESFKSLKKRFTCKVFLTTFRNSGAEIISESLKS